MAIVLRQMLEYWQWDQLANLMRDRTRSDDDGSFERWLMTGNPGDARFVIKSYQGRQQPVRDFPIDDETVIGWYWWKGQLFGLQVVEVIIVNAGGEYEGISIFTQMNGYFIR